MPAALPIMKLGDVQPTEEELKQARAIKGAADKGKLRSIDTGFKDYLKKHPDVAAQGCTGELKEHFILNFMVLQARSKNSTKTLSASHEVKISSGRHVEKHWWNEHQMDTELGKMVAQHWRDSGNIQHKPCPVTGSTAPEHKIWGVPKLWESLTEADIKALRLETHAEAKEGDAETIHEASMLTRGAISATAPSVEKTPEDIQKEYEADIQGKPAVYIRKYQDMKTDCVVLLATAEPDRTKSKFASMLCTDVENVVKQIEKVLKSLEAILTKSAKEKESEKVAKALLLIDKDHGDVMRWAKNFGYEIKPEPKKKRSRKET